MTTLVERLRIFGCEPDTGNTYHEAADRIEIEPEDEDNYFEDDEG